MPDYSLWFRYDMTEILTESEIDIEEARNLAYSWDEKLQDILTEIEVKNRELHIAK